MQAADAPGESATGRLDHARHGPFRLLRDAPAMRSVTVRKECCRSLPIDPGLHHNPPMGYHSVVEIRAECQSFRLEQARLNHQPRCLKRRDQLCVYPRQRAAMGIL
jgi:hypothetical protein